MATYSSFLCLRRGVSLTGLMNEALAAFSLPTQRCFLLLRRQYAVHPLFSAYAEVFLNTFHL